VRVTEADRGQFDVGLTESVARQKGMSVDVHVNDMQDMLGRA
jgi:hypothetical protein